MGWFSKYPGTDYSQITLDHFIHELSEIGKTVADLVQRVIRLENQGGGGGGTTDYDDLTDKPQINSVTLQGNKTASQLGLATPADIISDYDDLSDKPKLNNKVIEGDRQDGYYHIQHEIDISTSYPGDVPVLNLDGDFEAKTLTAGDVGAIPAPASPSAGDVLSYDNVNDEWEGATPHYIPPGGLTGQVLKKASATDYDASWQNESGGSERAWSLLQTIDIAQDGSGSITINDLDNFTEFMCFGNLVKNASTTQSGYTITVNGTDLSQSGVTISKSTTNQYNWCYIFYDGMFWHVCHHQPTVNNNYIAGGNLLVPYFFKENVGKCTTFKLSAPAAAYQAVSGTIKIWGR